VFKDPAFVMFGGFFFLSSDPFTLGVRIFSFLIFFLTIVSVSDVPRGWVQDLLGHQKQWNPPLGSGLP